KIFNDLRAKIQKATQKDAIIEHVGGTSLKKPSGKGDIDIYIAYTNKNSRKEMESVLTKLIGKPGKITTNRTRYNIIIDGIAVEIQLTNESSLGAAVALRNYLNKHSNEAKSYAKSAAKMRKDFLDKMFKLKSSFTQKAVSRK